MGKGVIKRALIAASAWTLVAYSVSGGAELVTLEKGNQAYREGKYEEARANVGSPSTSIDTPSHAECPSKEGEPPSRTPNRCDLKKDEGAREQHAERQHQDHLDAELEVMRTKPVARTEVEEPHGITLSSRSCWKGRAPPHRARQSHHRGHGPLHTITRSGLSGSVHSGESGSRRAICERPISNEAS